MVTKVKKSHDLPPPSQRTRKAGGVSFILSLKAQETGVSVSESRRRWASQLKPRADLPSHHFFFKAELSGFLKNYLFLVALGLHSCAHLLLL